MTFIDKIYLVFKTHLDVGFTDFAQKVQERYFECYIPRAIEVARGLRQQGRPERLVWTTGSWMIYEYLEQSDPAGRRLMEQAIADGDIVWHGLPFTMHCELMDPSLFRYGLSLASRLDQRFGKKTIAAKMTDVPGHTRGIVPLLAEAGIQFLHIGVNPASTAPRVPPVFVWRSPEGAEVIVGYQRGSYGDLMQVEGMDSAMVFAHTNDNEGPQSFEQTLQIYESLKQRFPGATLCAAPMDDYARDLIPHKARLPVLTCEVGDTWIHGMATDPRKVSLFRGLCRLRRQWEEQAAGQGLNGQSLETFSRQLLMVPEHTWGMDEKTHLSDFAHYSRESFGAVRSQPRFVKFEASWQEQRQYLSRAIDALPEGPLRAQAQQAVQDLHPGRPSVEGYKKIEDPQTLIQTGQFEIRFDDGGALAHLLDQSTGRRWATAGHPLGAVGYEVFSKQDYDRFYQRYVINKRETQAWSRPDFSKPGLENAVQAHQWWSMRLKELWLRREGAQTRCLLHLVPPAPAHEQFGCPAEFFVTWIFAEDSARIELELTWHSKPACRMSEALWLTLRPPLGAGALCTLDKMDQSISARDVIKDGNRRMHAVSRGLELGDAQGAVQIQTLDAPLVGVGEPALLNFHNRPPDLKRGVHFNLYNNVWGTNFPMWYDEDARFRFILNFTCNPKARPKPGPAKQLQGALS